MSSIFLESWWFIISCSTRKQTRTKSSGAYPMLKPQWQNPVWTLNAYSRKKFWRINLGKGKSWWKQGGWFGGFLKIKPWQNVKRGGTKRLLENEVFTVESTQKLGSKISVNRGTTGLSRNPVQTSFITYKL